MLALLLAAGTRALTSAAAAEPWVRHVDCAHGSDATGDGSAARPFRSPHRAQRALRALRSGAADASAAATVKVSGLCELPATLALEAADSHAQWVGVGEGAILSGGTQLPATPAGADASAPTTVDLKPLNFSSASLGTLKGRGYAGGSACILLNNYESSPAELFYRPPGPASNAGARSSGPEAVGMMRMARYPSVMGAVPSTGDWAKITSVKNHTLGVSGANGKVLAGGAAELEQGNQLFAHGLWKWNWADSHRPVVSVDVEGGTITVGNDDWGHDVDPIVTGHGSAQGGNLCADTNAA